MTNDGDEARHKRSFSEWLLARHPSEMAATALWVGTFILAAVNFGIYQSVENCVASCTAKGLEMLITLPAGFILFIAAIGVSGYALSRKHAKSS